jgi:DNA polymerase-3 subunit alpha
MNHKFIHLRVQSSYSLLESALKIKQMIALAKKFDMPALGLADRNNLFGSLEFSISAIKEGIQPIHGITLMLQYQKAGSQEYGEIVVIAKNDIGRQNLLKLASYPYIKNDRRIKEHITLEDLQQCKDGLIVISSYQDGLISNHINDLEFAKDLAIQLQDQLKDNFYCEITRHGSSKEKGNEFAYLNLASQLSIPVVANNKVLFSDVSMHDVHDVLLCIAQGSKKYLTNRITSNNQTYFKSQEEMYDLFPDLSGALLNSWYIAQRCAASFITSDPILPKFSNNSSQDKLLESKAYEGLEKKLKIKFKDQSPPLELQQEISAHYFQRLDYELSVICQMKFAGYFLIVADFIAWSKSQGIAVGPGRGSGAGSIVAWCLQITDLDPIRFGLIFERFLNPERVSMPDFDIDFCQERRDEVISYVSNKYGNERVAHIITFGSMQAKGVIKDVARSLDLRYRYAEYMTELVPFNAVNPVTLTQAIEEVGELKNIYQGKGFYNPEILDTDLDDQEEQEFNDLIKEVLSIALELEGLHRHVSTHAAGVVIAGKDLMEIVPLYADKNSKLLIVQYSMKYAELAGLVKFDFLGLQTLTVISHCIKLLKSYGIELEIDNIPLDDPLVYEMLSTGKTVGIFQFESPGMKEAIKRLVPDRIDDLMALSALYRPGPMDNIPIYIACKHGKQKPNYMHELLEPILKETYGVIIYQEQVLEVAKVLAGYSLGRADLLRRAMGKKIKSEMDAQQEMFIKGSMANGIDQDKAREIFALVEKFAGYGFNKAHAAAYAVISYQTAYLKTHYFAYFLIAALNLDINDHDKIAVFIDEAKKNAIQIVPVDINISAGYFTLDVDNHKSILFALGAIKGVTPEVGNEIAQERDNKGAFTSIIDFIERMPLKSINKKCLESLIKSGSFDALHSNRKQLLSSIDRLIAHMNSYHHDKAHNQLSFFGKLSSSDLLTKSEEDYSFLEKSNQEFASLGSFFKFHPIEFYKDVFSGHGVISSRNLKGLRSGISQVKIAGVIQKKDARLSSRGRFITLYLSDIFGIFEVSIFNEDIIKNYNDFLNVQQCAVFNCEVQKDQYSIKMVVLSIESIQEIMKSNIYNMQLYVPEVKLQSVLEFLKSKTFANTGNSRIHLLINYDDFFLLNLKLPSIFYLEIEDVKYLQQYESR